MKKLFVLMLLLVGCGDGALSVDYTEVENVDPLFEDRPVLALHEVRIPSVDGEIVEATAIESHDGIFLEGDILIEPEHLVETQEGDLQTRTNELAALHTNLWPNRVVPYVIASSARHRRADIEAAINVWNNKTNLRIRKKRASDTHFVRFEKVASGCSANIGRQAKVTKVYIANNCDRGAIRHEIGHAIGLWHTQSRTDRSKYVKINWDNIKSGNAYNFKTYKGQGFGPYSRNVGSYQYGSLMHYSSYAFSRNGKPTIVKRGKTGSARLIKPSRKLTDGDAARVNKLYPK